MAATYWLFVVLIVGFLAIGSRLESLAALVEEMKQEISALRRERSKDKEQIEHLGYPGYYEPPVKDTSLEPSLPRPSAFIRAMRWSGNCVGRLLRRAS